MLRALAAAAGGAALPLFSYKSSRAADENITPEIPPEFLEDGSWWEGDERKIKCPIPCPFGLKRAYKCVWARNINYDTRVFRFALDPDEYYFIPPFGCLIVDIPWGPSRNEVAKWPVTRLYTPISPNFTKGFFDLMVKIYPGGHTSPILYKIQPGDKVRMKAANRQLHYSPNKWKQIGMIAGGVGITPLLQMAWEVLHNPVDNTKIKLLYANHTPQDIALKHTFDELQKKFPEQLEVQYMVSDPEGEKWDGPNDHVGRMNLEFLKKHLPDADPDNFIAICGPDEMLLDFCGVNPAMVAAWHNRLRQPPLAGANNNAALQGYLEDLGFSASNVYRF